MLKVGTRVRITQGSGTLSGKEGRICSPRRIRLSPHGVPLLPGYYKPPDWSRESSLRLDTGEIHLMFDNRLEVLDEN